MIARAMCVVSSRKNSRENCLRLSDCGSNRSRGSGALFIIFREAIDSAFRLLFGFRNRKGMAALDLNCLARKSWTATAAAIVRADLPSAKLIYYAICPQFSMILQYGYV